MLCYALGFIMAGHLSLCLIDVSHRKWSWVAVWTVLLVVWLLYTWWGCF